MLVTARQRSYREVMFSAVSVGLSVRGVSLYRPPGHAQTCFTLMCGLSGSRRFAFKWNTFLLSIYSSISMKIILLYLRKFELARKMEKLEKINSSAKRPMRVSWTVNMMMLLLKGNDTWNCFPRAAYFSLSETMFMKMNLIGKSPNCQFPDTWTRMTLCARLSDYAQSHTSNLNHLSNYRWEHLASVRI